MFALPHKNGLEKSLVYSAYIYISFPFVVSETSLVRANSQPKTRTTRKSSNNQTEEKNVKKKSKRDKYLKGRNARVVVLYVMRRRKFVLLTHSPDEDASRTYRGSVKRLFFFPTPSLSLSPSVYQYITYCVRIDWFTYNSLGIKFYCCVRSTT